MEDWKFEFRSAIIGFIAGALLMVLAGTLRPPA